MSVRISAPTADDVRAWARNKGLDVSDRGRIAFTVIEAFNKGRKHTYAPTLIQANAATTAKVAVTKLGKNGRKVRTTETVVVSEVRAWARDNGFDVGLRGRIPAEVLTAYGQRNLPVA